MNDQHKIPTDGLTPLRGAGLPPGQARNHNHYRTDFRKSQQKSALHLWKAPLFFREALHPRPELIPLNRIYAARGG